MEFKTQDIGKIPYRTKVITDAAELSVALESVRDESISSAVESVNSDGAFEYEYEDCTSDFVISSGYWQNYNGVINSGAGYATSEIIPLSSLEGRCASFSVFTAMVGMNLFDDDNNFLGYAFASQTYSSVAAAKRLYVRRFVLTKSNILEKAVAAKGKDVTKVSKVRLMTTFETQIPLKFEKVIKTPVKLFSQVEECHEKNRQMDNSIDLYGSYVDYTGTFESAFINPGQITIQRQLTSFADEYLMTELIPLMNGDGSPKYDKIRFTATEKATISALYGKREGCMCVYAIYDTNQKALCEADYHGGKDELTQEFKYENVELDVRKILDDVENAGYIRFCSYNGLSCGLSVEMKPFNRVNNGILRDLCDVKVCKPLNKVKVGVQLDSCFQYGSGKSLQNYTESVVTQMIPIESGKSYLYNAARQYATATYALFGEGSNLSSTPIKLCGVLEKTDPYYTTHQQILSATFNCNEIMEQYPKARYVSFSAYKVDNQTSAVDVWEAIPSVSKALDRIDGQISALSAKIEEFEIPTTDYFTKTNYIALGDSFTSPDYSYANLIATRNKMTFTKCAIGGMMVWWDEARKTQSDLSGRTSLNRDDRLMKLSNEISVADYITFQYGLNDAGHGCVYGEKTDSAVSTVWGAWNTSLSNILTLNPDVKIGIIISDNGIGRTMHDTLLSVGEYWGIPVLDLKDDINIPLGIGGRLSYEINPYAKSQRDKVFKMADDDSHPNSIAHQYRSTIIENFMRSL